MSVNGLCQRLAQFTFNSSKQFKAVAETTRHLQTSSVCCKNFQLRIPHHIEKGFGRVRLPVNAPKEYTIEPIPTAKTGGRGPDGKVWVHRIGGGVKKWYRMIDYHRINNRVRPQDKEPLVEKVYEVRPDDFKSAHIALVASENQKRWILASENMKPGDLIKSHTELSTMPVRAQDGDAHPIGSLPIGTLVHNVMGRVARSAGTSGVYLRKIGDKCVIRMPSKREIIVPETSMCSVGRVSNVDHNKYKMSSAGENRRRGVRPHSGLWQRKDGRFGRKNRPIKPPIDTVSVGKKIPVFADRFTFQD